MLIVTIYYSVTTEEYKSSDLTDHHNLYVCVCVYYIIDLYMDSLKDVSSVPTGDTSAGRWGLVI